MVSARLPLLIFSLLPLGGRSEKEGSAAPSQVHLALGGSVDEDGYNTGVRISWVTERECTGAEDESVVEWGVAGSALNETATSNDCSTYFSTWDHTVVIEGLIPGEIYSYQVGGWSTFSRLFNFTMPTRELDLPLVVLADMDVMSATGQSTVAAVSKLVEESKISIVVHAGDIGYADNSFIYYSPWLFTYERAYNRFMEAIEPISSAIPYMVAVGNHEAECHSPSCQTSPSKLNKLSNYAAYNSRWAMPSQESGGVENMWYSFNVGPIHFAVISSETDYPGNPPNLYTSWDGTNGGFGDQLSWLKADLELAQQERDLRPWIIVVGHRPIYTVDDVDSEGNPANKPGLSPGVSRSMQEAFEEIFNEYGVDLYFCGHKHSYERSYPVFDGQVESKKYVNAEDTTYLLVGSSGNLEGNDDYTNDKDVQWNAVVDTEHIGFGLLASVGSDSLKWTYLDSADGKTILDEITLTKKK